MKRESLFETSQLEKIKNEELINWESFENKKRSLEIISDNILNGLNNLTKYMFESGDFNFIADYQRIKKLIKRRRPVKQKLLANCLDEVKNTIYNYNVVLNQVIELEAAIENAFKQKGCYDDFILNEEFQDAVKVTTENAARQLLEPTLTKESVNRARYRYIQRATVKTSPLSYFGKTFYYSKENKICEQVRLNHVVKYLILMASMYNEELNQKLRIKTMPILEKCTATQAVYFEKNYLLKGFDWIIKHDDLMHQKYAIEVLKSIQHCKTPAEVKSILLNNKEIQYELIVNNGFVKPDFHYYLDNEEELKRLLEVLFTNENLKLFFPANIREMQHDLLRRVLSQYLKKFDNEYSGQTYEETLNQIPLFYHDYVELQSYELPAISEEYKQNILNEYVVMNEKSYFIHKLVRNNKELFEGKSILAVMADLNERINYKKTSSLVDVPFVTSMKKNALIYVQSTKNEVILNNINIGNGGIYHRFGYCFNDDIKEQLSRYYKGLFESDYPIYELIVDEEISNHMDVGNTIFPNLYWPEDFVDVTVEFEGDAIKMVKNGVPFELVYTGTVPYYLFTGIKSHLLQLIHPWAIDLKVLTSKIRKSYTIDLSAICDDESVSDVEFYRYLREYVKTHGLPIEFFVKKKYHQFAARKPIWISLHSVESVKVLRHLLHKEQLIEIEEVCPRFNGDKVKEYCILIAEGEM